MDFLVEKVTSICMEPGQDYDKQVWELCCVYHVFGEMPKDIENPPLEV